MGQKVYLCLCSTWHIVVNYCTSTCANIKTITELHACVIRLDQYVTSFDFIIKSVCLGVE